MDAMETMNRQTTEVTTTTATDKCATHQTFISCIKSERKIYGIRYVGKREEEGKYRAIVAQSSAIYQAIYACIVKKMWKRRSRGVRGQTSREKERVRKRRKVYIDRKMRMVTRAGGMKSIKVMQKPDVI